MLEVTFKSLVPGVCGWCGKEKEAVYDIAFGDQSFVGRLCKNDLLRAVGLKLSATTTLAQPTRPATAAASCAEDATR